MGRPESLDAERKAEAIAAIKAGNLYSVVANTYGVCEMTLRRYVKKATETSKEPAKYSENDRMRGEEAAREAANTMKPEEPPMPEAA